MKSGISLGVRVSCGYPEAEKKRSRFIPVGRYLLRFRGAAGPEGGGYLGSAWRGLFGRELKRLVCVTREKSCPDCLLYRSCVYPYVFETPPPADAEMLRKYPAAPHPYILWIPREAKEEGVYELGLTLVGRAAGYLAYVLHALRSAGQQAPRGLPPLTLEEVLEEQHAGSGHWRSVFDAATEELRPSGALAAVEEPPPALVRVHLCTPLRIRHEEKYVSPRSFKPADLLRSVVRRVGLLEYFHGEGRREEDFAGLAERSKAVEMENAKLYWRDWTRYSSRQGRKVEMGGVTGRFTMRLEGHEEFWPWLNIGQWVHAGKGTVMGLGQFRLEPLNGGKDVSGR